MERVIHHFGRLSSLSLHQLVKVSLSQLIKLLERTLPHQSCSRGTERVRLSSTNSSPPQFQKYPQGLRELHLLIDEATANDSLQLVLKLTEHALGRFSALKEVEIEGPLVVSLEAGEQGPKRLRLINSHSKIEVPVNIFQVCIVPESLNMAWHTPF